MTSLRRLRLWFQLGFGLVAASTGEAQSNYETPYYFTTLAGESSVGNADGLGSVARFHAPWGVVAAPDGTVFVADTHNHVVRKISPTGRVTTLAGKTGDAQAKDGAVNVARFIQPSAIARDTAGNLYIQDWGTIRKITPDGIVTTLAGQAGVFADKDGVGTQATFASPTALTVDPAGNIFVVDRDSHTIRKIAADGTVTTFAGQAGRNGGNDGSGSGASFGYPYAIAADQAGNLYVTDLNGIRKITPDGIVSTLASIDRNSPAEGITVDPTGIVYVGRTETLWKLTPGSGLVLFAGRSGQRGSDDGDATTATFDYLPSLTSDAAGNLYVAEPYSNIVRKVTPAGIVATLAGLPPSRSTGSAAGLGAAARFGEQLAAALGPTGDLFVADAANHTIRRVTAAGAVSTFAGMAGISGSADGVGSAARFSSPTALAFDQVGNLFVSDTGNHTIRQISPDGTVTTLAGTAGQAGSSDGMGANARFEGSYTMAVSPDGSLYLYGNGSLRRVTSAGLVSTLGENRGGFYYPDGSGLAFSPGGRLFLAGRFTIDEISPVDGHYMQLFAGDIEDRNRFDGLGHQLLFGNDGIREGAHFYECKGLTFDLAGNAYAVDNGNSTIRRVSPDARSTTLAGLAGPLEVGLNHIDGVGAEARFANPTDIVHAPGGVLYVVDGSTIRKGVLAAAPAITTQPASQSAASGASVTFSTTAAGTPVPTYQWHFNGAPIPGATENTLTLTNVRTSDAGNYAVFITNPVGSTVSNTATLTVSTPAQPPPPTGGGSSGGGGAPSWWSLAFLAGLGLARRFFPRSASPLTKGTPP